MLLFTGPEHGSVQPVAVCGSLQQDSIFDAEKIVCYLVQANRVWIRKTWHAELRLLFSFPFLQPIQMKCWDTQGDICNYLLTTGLIERGKKNRAEEKVGQKSIKFPEESEKRRYLVQEERKLSNCLSDDLLSHWAALFWCERMFTCCIARPKGQEADRGCSWSWWRDKWFCTSVCCNCWFLRDHGGLISQWCNNPVLYASHWEYCPLRGEFFCAALQHPSGQTFLPVKAWPSPDLFSFLVTIKLAGQMTVNAFCLFDENIFLNNWFDSCKKYPRLRVEWVADKFLNWKHSQGR